VTTGRQYRRWYFGRHETEQHPFYVGRHWRELGTPMPHYEVHRHEAYMKIKGVHYCQCNYRW
jgi:hypothetical protein